MIHQWRRENYQKNPIFMWGQSLLLLSIEKDNWWLLVVMNAQKDPSSPRTCFWSSNLFKQSWREHPLPKQPKMISSPNPPVLWNHWGPHVCQLCSNVLIMNRRVLDFSCLLRTFLCLQRWNRMAEEQKSAKSWPDLEEHSQKTKKNNFSPTPHPSPYLPYSPPSFVFFFF